jgi:hypothetical protein
MDEMFDVVGPVLAEVFVVWADSQGLHLSGPCGAEPWYLEVEAGADPMVVVQRVAMAVLGGVRLLHSTSWRRDRTGVVLTFLAVVDPSVCAELVSVGVPRAELARGSSSAAPAEIASAQVLEHALRHLAWLDKDDPVVMGALTETWKTALGGYKPEPFRHLG